MLRVNKDDIFVHYLAWNVYSKEYNISQGTQEMPQSKYTAFP